MRFPGPILPALLCAASLAAQPPHQFHRLDGSTITAAKAHAFAAETLNEAHVTGAELAVIRDGKLVWKDAFGLRRVDPPLPMETGTNIWAASITKSVFATYVMQLVEKGEFDLDTPVARQLDKPLDSYEPYRETGTELVKDPNWLLVTPRMLLSHQSGLANFAYLEPDKKIHLRFKPGTQFLYSGEGINLVQFLVEQKAHKRVDQLLQEALFGPLDMAQTGLIYREAFAANVADRYDRNGKFISKTQRFPPRAAGSMATSVDDLAKFAEALVNGRLLKSETRKAMLSPQLKLNMLHQFPLALNEGTSVEAERVGLAYGIGWGLLTKTRFGPAFFKEGHGDGAQNYMICFTRSRSCMILLTNSDNGELAFRPLLETILGDTETPWEWEGYTPEYIEASRKQN